MKKGNAWIKGELVQAVDAAAGIKLFKIRLEQGIKPLPGQFIMLSFADNPELRRAYSIVSYDSRNKELLLCIKKAGVFTSRLFSAKMKSRTLVSKPCGVFTLPEKPRALVFIAGGIGISPIYNLITSIKAQDYPKKAYLFYSAKTAAGMAFRKELKQINSDKINVFFFFTQEKAKEGANKRIACSMIKDTVPDFKDCLFYMCGPQAMMDDLKNQLTKCGIDKEDIKSEGFGALKDAPA